MSRKLRFELESCPSAFKRPGFCIKAIDRKDDAVVGEIAVRKQTWIDGMKNVWGVEHIYAKRLREGIGTQLYTKAAHEACKRGGSFISDMERSPEADAFWRKQATKGRATRVEAKLLDNTVDFYLIGCPAPSSLSGARRRKRR